MEQLHPCAERLIETAPASAIIAAIGQDGSLTNQLDTFTGVRLSPGVKAQPPSLIIGWSNDCAEAVLDKVHGNRAAAFLVFKGRPEGRAYAFLEPCRERKPHFERAIILHSDNASIMGLAFIIPRISLTEADGIAYRFGMAAFIYMERGLLVRLLVTG